MKRYRLFNSLALIVAIKYVSLYLLIIVALTIAFFFSAHKNIESEYLNQLQQIYNHVASTDNQKRKQVLLQQINTFQSKHDDGTLYYLYSTADSNKIIGNISTVPEELEEVTPATAQKIWINEESLPEAEWDDYSLFPVITGQLNNADELLLIYAVEQSEQLSEALEWLLVSLPIVALVLFAVGISVSNSILERVKKIIQTSRMITEGKLSQRIPLNDRMDEFDQLAVQLNQMLDANQKLINSMQEVTVNIAHDLRSPLTRIRNQLEISLIKQRTTEEYRKVINNSIKEVIGLINTFNALLNIARLESGDHATQKTDLRLDTLIMEIYELYRQAVQNKQQQLKISRLPEITIKGSRDLLAQALSNIIENSMKYAPKNTCISLSLIQNDNWAIITIRDQGPGIPEAEHQRVTERFVQLDNARHEQGNGLGLSLVKAVSNFHKGILDLSNGSPGLIISIKLPLV